MRTIALVLIVALAATSCSQRDHSNPLDPDNPITSGRPLAFTALAGNQNVQLKWSPVAGLSVLGYRLERRAAGESDFQLLPELRPTAQDYLDLDVVNGTRYDYRLSYLLTGGAISNASADAATPGPLRVWITDLGSARVLRLTPDGRHVARVEIGFVSPIAVAVDPIQGSVWVSDSYYGFVERISGNSDRITIDDPDRPGAIAVDPVRHTAWVCDEGQGQLLQFQLNGAAGTPPAIGSIQLPLAVAVDPRDQTVWVCDNGGRLVRRYASTGGPLWSLPVPRPSRIAVDSLSRDAYVTSFEGRVLLRVGVDGAALDTIGGFAGPIGVAVDPRRGRVWVADALGGALVSLTRGGSVVHRIEGLAEVRELVVDLASGNVWATVPAQKRVVIVNVDGVIVGQLGGLLQPFAIALDPGASPFDAESDYSRLSTMTRRASVAPPMRTRSK